MADMHRTVPTGWGRLPGWAPDVLAAVLAAAVLVGVSSCVRASSGRALDEPGYALLVAAGGAMGLCRRWPRAAAAVVTVVLALFVARRYPDGPVWATGGWRWPR